MKQNTRPRFVRRLGLFVALVLLVPLTLGAHPSGFDWEGEHWTLWGDADAMLDDGDAEIESTAGASGGAGLHIDVADLTDANIHVDDQPWVRFSYIDDGVSQEGIDLFINPGSSDARISAGSMFTFAEGFGLERFGTGGSLEQNELFIKGFGERAVGEHTVYIGQRPDGTIDANFNDVWFSSAFLKDNGEAPFEFEDILLRWRGGDAEDTITFTHFDYGDDHLEQRGNVTYVVDNDFEVFPDGCEGLHPTHVTIQSAVDVALPGDTIKVCRSTYDENVLVETDGLAIIGVDEPVLTSTEPTLPSGNDRGNFRIRADDVTVTGFVLDGGHYGVRASGSNNVISHNDVHGMSFRGIVAGGAGNVVSHNTVTSGSRHGIQLVGSGSDASQNTVTGVNRSAFVVVGTAHSVSHNIASGSGRDGSDGFVVTGSDHTINHNEITENGRIRSGDREGSGLVVRANNTSIVHNVVERNFSNGVVLDGDGNMVNQSRMCDNGHDDLFVAGGFRNTIQNSEFDTELDDGTQTRLRRNDDC